MLDGAARTLAQQPKQFIITKAQANGQDFTSAAHLQNGLVHNYLVTIDSSGRTLLFNGNVVSLSGPTTDCYVAIDLKPNTNYHVYV